MVRVFSQRVSQKTLGGSRLIPEAALVTVKRRARTDL